MSMRLSRSIVGEAEAEAVRRVIVEDGYLGMGHETCLFEQELAAYLGVAPGQVVTTNTGTAALTLAVDAIAPRDAARKPQILVPSLTFVASFQAIVAAGCEPVACDVLAGTGTIDLGDAARRITPDTLAIMPVHYASNPWHLDEVHAFAREHGLRVIEDAAHAFGCLHHGRKIGSFGDVVCFSFDGIKNITSGEGGCALRGGRHPLPLCRYPHLGPGREAHRLAFPHEQHHGRHRPRAAFASGRGIHPGPPRPGRHLPAASGGA